MSELKTHLKTAGGRITCRRCQGKSRRTRLQCGAPAEVGSNWCRFHGSRATGPTTAEGLAKFAAVKWKGIGDTRKKRERNRLSSQSIKRCEYLLRSLQVLN